MRAFKRYLIAKLTESGKSRLFETHRCHLLNLDRVCCRFPRARHIIGRIMYASIGNMTLRKTSAVVSMQLCCAGLMAKLECMAWAGHCESVRLSPCELDQTLHLTLGTANLCEGIDQTIAPCLPNPAVLGSGVHFHFRILSKSFEMASRVQAKPSLSTMTAWVLQDGPD